MIKRLVLVGVFAVGLVAVFHSQVSAWTIGGGGWAWGSYEAWWDIRGGQTPGTESTYAATYVNVMDAALVCVNPGNNKQDVRVGKGGITLAKASASSEFQYDERGRYFLTENFNSSILEFAKDRYNDGDGELNCNPTQSLAELILNCPQAISDFNALYHVSASDCRNANWTPYMYLMKSINLEGNILTDCGSFDVSDCDLDAELCLYCVTDEDYRKWAEDGSVIYICEEISCPEQE